MRSRFVNADIIAKNITNGDYLERNLLAAQKAESLREYYLSSHQSFAFETVGSRPDKLEFMRRAREEGFAIHIIFVTTCSPEINKSRILSRESKGGHGVPEEKIVSRYHRTMDLLPEYVKMADEFLAIDNSGNHPVPVFSKVGQRCRVIENPSLIPWVGNLYNQYPQSTRDLKDPQDVDVYTRYRKD